MKMTLTSMASLARHEGVPDGLHQQDRPAQPTHRPLGLLRLHGGFGRTSFEEIDFLQERFGRTSGSASSSAARAAPSPAGAPSAAGQSDSAGQSSSCSQQTCEGGAAREVP
jgi:hypothetical protein